MWCGNVFIHVYADRYPSKILKYIRMCVSYEKIIEWGKNFSLGGTMCFHGCSQWSNTHGVIGLTYYLVVTANIFYWLLMKVVLSKYWRWMIGYSFIIKLQVVTQCIEKKNKIIIRAEQKPQDHIHKTTHPPTTRTQNY